MPEGPQMVFLREQSEVFLGQPVLEASGTAPGIPFHLLKGQVLSHISTFGKEIFYAFPAFSIRIHLLLFGKYTINGELNRELQLGLTFETGTINFYACSCRLILAPLDQVYDWSLDVMHPAFSGNKALEKLLARPQKLICDALLDQHILAGVGNGIKNEALFRRHVHPASQAGKIPPAALLHLIQACVQLSFAYLDWLREGTADEHWLVYKKKQCPRDHMPLLKEKIGKTARTSYFCDKCQVLYLS